MLHKGEWIWESECEVHILGCIYIEKILLPKAFNILLLQQFSFPFCLPCLSFKYDDINYYGAFWKKISLKNLLCLNTFCYLLVCLFEIFLVCVNRTKEVNLLSEIIIKWNFIPLMEAAAQWVDEIKSSKFSNKNKKILRNFSQITSSFDND